MQHQIIQTNLESDLVHDQEYAKMIARTLVKKPFNQAQAFMDKLRASHSEDFVQQVLSQVSTVNREIMV